MYARTRRLLQHRWCPGAIIPPETRVDPSGFPDDKFPLRCPECEYLLQGLSDNRCPECGRPFDRGRLLVEQYLLLRDAPLTTAGKAARTASIFGWFLLIAAAISFSLLLTRIDPLKIDPTRFFFPIVCAFLLGALLTFISSQIWWHQQERHRTAQKERSQRVFDALDWNEPVFARAQCLRWIFLGLLLGLIAMLSLTFDLSADSWLESLPFLGMMALIGAYSLWQFWRWGPRRRKQS